MSLEQKLRLAIASGHVRAMVNLAATDEKVIITIEQSPIVLSVVGDTVTSNIGEINERNDV